MADAETSSPFSDQLPALHQCFPQGISATRNGLTFALQALLARHESYIQESQTEHRRMSRHVEDLESERVSLQSANEKIVAENKTLLSRLEALNDTLASSDDEVKRLQDLLLDCELEVKRLNGLVRKTENLENRVQEMERERIALDKEAAEGRVEARSTLARWRASERRVRELEEEVRRIEWEAKQDREKHEETIARMAKEHILERELGGAEGKLKGAAALQNIKTESTGSKNVVSHFVRDILQDNANLQAGIEELRCLLQTSNEEVQNLREQVLLHQSIDDPEKPELPQRTISLGEEIAAVEPQTNHLQQEVHVHHHYHAKIAKKERTHPVRRTGRKRAVLPNTGYVSDASESSTTQSRPRRFSPGPGLSLYQPRPAKSNRWSMQSTATNSTTFSSMPSSPRSYFDRTGSLFDRMEQEEEYSRPTSPESVAEYVSPTFQQGGLKVVESGLSIFEEEEPENVSPLDEGANTINSPGQEHCSETGQVQQHQEVTPKPSKILQISDEITAEELCLNSTNPVSEIDKIKAEAKSTTLLPEISTKTLPEVRPALRRIGSHESLVSISGMDIHLAQRPGPGTGLELLRGNSHHFAHSPSQSHKLTAAPPQACVTEYTVLSSPSMLSPPNSSRTIRRMPSGIEALSGIAVPPPRSSKSPASPGGLSRLVGGWVRGKWGMAPVKSASNLRTVLEDGGSIKTASSFSDQQSSTNPALETSSLLSSNSTSDAVTQEDVPGMALDTAVNITKLDADAVQSDTKADFDLIFGGRSPGVNQPGWIPGFRAAVMNKRTPTEVQAKVMDEEGLREGLAE